MYITPRHNNQTHNSYLQTIQLLRYTATWDMAAYPNLCKCNENGVDLIVRTCPFPRWEAAQLWRSKLSNIKNISCSTILRHNDMVYKVGMSFGWQRDRRIPAKNSAWTCLVWDQNHNTQGVTYSSCHELNEQTNSHYILHTMFIITSLG